MLEEQTEKMQAEPMVVDLDGNVSDASEHEEMLNNEAANTMSSRLAYETGKKLGFSDEELKEIFAA